MDPIAATGAALVAGNVVSAPGIDLDTLNMIAQAVTMLTGAALKGAFIVGVSEVLKRALFGDTPDQMKLRDRVMPFVAMSLGIVAYVLPAMMADAPITFDLFAYGVALGGATTGLYAIRKTEKSQPESEVNVRVPVTVPTGDGKVSTRD